MNKILIRFLSALLLSSITTLSYAADWALSFGANDMIVQGARPLEDAPNGSTSHTPGVQVAIHGKSDAEATIQQSGYFKVLVDKDKDKLDPDHIPVWFMGSYQAKTELVPFSQNTVLNAVLDLDLKANTVSSVERQIKLFAGISADYDTEKLSATLKASLGRFSLEIDDDVAKNRGYSRENLKRIEPAVSLMADTRFTINDAFALTLLAQTWQTDTHWLENQYSLALDYDSDSWAKGSTFVVSILHTQYNLEGYNLKGELPILPWNEDTLIQAYIVMPWEF